MANQCTYYFEVSGTYTDYIDTYAAGVYSTRGYTGGYTGRAELQLAMSSVRVWCQGPRGGVKIVKDRINYCGGVYGYITNNKKAMKEFAWVKLRARKLNQS